MKFKVQYWGLEEPSIDVIEGDTYDFEDGIFRVYSKGGYLVKAYGRGAWQTVERVVEDV